MKNRPLRVLALFLLALLTLSACGGQGSATVAADEVPVVIGSGLSEDRVPKGCKKQGNNQVIDLSGDDYVPLPAGQRNYKAKADDPTAEQGPLTFTVRGVEMRTDVQVEMILNTDCRRSKPEVLSPAEEFAQRFALKYQRQYKDAKDPMEWWSALLRDHVGRQSDQALDNAAAQLVAEFDAQKKPLDWRTVLSDERVKADLERRAGAEAQRLLEAQLGGRKFCGPGSTPTECKPLLFTITPPRPVRAEYVELITQEDAASGQARIAGQQKVANDARIDAERELLKTYGPEGLLERQRLDLLREAIEKGQVQVLPVPAGANITIPAK